MGVQADTIWTPFSRLTVPCRPPGLPWDPQAPICSVVQGPCVLLLDRYLQILTSTPRVCDQGQGDQPLWASDTCLLGRAMPAPWGRAGL